MRAHLAISGVFLLVAILPGVVQADAPVWVNPGSQIVYEYTLKAADGRIEQESVTTVRVESLTGGHAIIVQASSPPVAADGVYAVDLKSRSITEASVAAGGYYPLWLPLVEPGEVIQNHLIPCRVLPEDPAQPDYLDLECERSVELENGTVTVEGTYRYGRQSRMMFMSELVVVGHSRETLVAVDTHFAGSGGTLSEGPGSAASPLSLLGVTALWVVAASGTAVLLRRTDPRQSPRTRLGFCTECGTQRRIGFKYCLECGGDLDEGGA